MKTNEMRTSLEMAAPVLEDQLETVVNTGNSNCTDGPFGETEKVQLSAPSTVDDEAFRSHREKIIARGIHSGIPAAVAMAEIHGHKNGMLWKSDFSTFEAYCRKKWDLGRSHSYRMVDYGNFVIELRNRSFPQKKIPTREAQVRLVLKLPKDLRMEFWTEYAEKQTDMEMTTKSIASAITKFSEVRNLVGRPVKKWAEKSRENFLRFKAALLEEEVGKDPKIGQLIFEIGKRLEEVINENRNSRSMAVDAMR